MTTAAPGTGVADARRENPTDVQSVDAQTMEVENMG
jgi:hypothetical protein